MSTVGFLLLALGVFIAIEALKNLQGSTSASTTGGTGGSVGAPVGTGGVIQNAGQSAASGARAAAGDIVNGQGSYGDLQPTGTQYWSAEQIFSGLVQRGLGVADAITGTAVLLYESGGGNTQANNGIAFGLGQFTLPTAQDVGLQNPYDPNQALDAVVRLFHKNQAAGLPGFNSWDAFKYNTGYQYVGPGAQGAAYQSQLGRAEQAAASLLGVNVQGVF